MCLCFQPTTFKIILKFPLKSVGRPYTSHISLFFQTTSSDLVAFRTFQSKATLLHSMCDSEIFEISRSEVFTTIKIYVLVFCVVTPCSDVVGCQCFGGPYCCFHHNPEESDLKDTKFLKILCLLSVLKIMFSKI